MHDGIRRGSESGSASTPARPGGAGTIGPAHPFLFGKGGVVIKCEFLLNKGWSFPRQPAPGAAAAAPSVSDQRLSGGVWGAAQGGGTAPADRSADAGSPPPLKEPTEMWP